MYINTMLLSLKWDFRGELVPEDRKRVASVLINPMAGQLAERIQDRKSQKGSTITVEP
jgi:hypothetical protein